MLQHAENATLTGCVYWQDLVCGRDIIVARPGRPAASGVGSGGKWTVYSVVWVKLVGWFVVERIVLLMFSLMEILSNSYSDIFAVIVTFCLQDFGQLRQLITLKPTFGADSAVHDCARYRYCLCALRARSSSGFLLRRPAVGLSIYLLL